MGLMGLIVNSKAKNLNYTHQHTMKGRHRPK